MGDVAAWAPWLAIPAVLVFMGVDAYFDHRANERREDRLAREAERDRCDHPHDE